MFTAQRSLTEWSHGFSLSSQRRSSHFSRFLIRQCVLSSLRSRSDFRSRCYSNGGSCSRSKRDLQFHRAAQCCRLQHSHVDAVIEQLDLLNEIFGGEDAAHSPRYGDMGRIHLNAKTRPLLGAVDCVSIKRPHSNRAPFANVFARLFESVWVSAPHLPISTWSHMTPNFRRRRLIGSAKARH
jgi:hypothetical protein